MAERIDSDSVENLKAECERLKDKITELEDRNRRNNLRFDGLTELTDGET